MDNQVLDRQMLRVEDAAAYVGLSVSTMNKMRLDGSGAPYSKLLKAVVYRRSDLDDWINSNRRLSTSVAA